MANLPEINLNCDISNFIKHYDSNEGLKINLNDCQINIKGNIVVGAVKNNIAQNEPFVVNVVNPASKQNKLFQPQPQPQSSILSPIKLCGKKFNAKKAYVSISHYRFREKMGIINRADLRNFPLDELFNYFTPDILPKDVIKELQELGMTTLGDLLGIGVLGLKYRLTNKYKMEPDENFLGTMVYHIRKTFSYLGLKFSHKHPHNENDDGTPKNKEVV